ncbi:hypothetical protein BX261_7360 [Streptomyces sp. 2321.6]|uniref:hypothetical protein n=1 Tax=Streptomyces sp. 2321.6 TaxID=1938840 RepID=UPI000BB10981|nr:hypothetical protein [Streptomyces sp. 2321.6]PBC72276.1 hypothetical protein BX261_7360 [Streptomyces sp. 2321.6]
MQDFRTTAHVSTIGPRTARPVVPIRNQADELLLENAVAFASLVQAAMAAAPNGSLGDPAAVHAISDPDTGNLIGGGQLPDHVVRTLTAVYREAADRLAGDDGLTALMDAVFPPAPRLLALAGGA